MKARLRSILIVRFHLLTFAICLAFVDDRFMDWPNFMTFKWEVADVSVKVSWFRAVALKPLLPLCIFLFPGQLFTSCREVQMRQSVKIDGEYYLKVKSRILQVCLSCQNFLFAHPDSSCGLPSGSHLLPRCVCPQIYCAEMQTDFPKEYVTLRSGQTDNYSEVYGYRCV